MPSIPQDLSAHHVIQVLPLAPSLERTFGGALHGAGEEVRVSVAAQYVTNSVDAALWHAEHGGGLTLALSYQVVESVRAGRLRLVLTEQDAAATDSVGLSHVAAPVGEVASVHRSCCEPQRVAIYPILLKTRKNDVSLPSRSMLTTSTRMVLPSGATRRTPLLMIMSPNFATMLTAYSSSTVSE